MPEEISTKKYLSELKKLVQSMGGPIKAAEKIDISRQFLYVALRGEKLPGKKILKAMGLKECKEVRYRYKRIKATQ